ncbi:MAG TPA: hypothetical protein VIJ47_03640 [Acidimicrobiales bacterium]
MNDDLHLPEPDPADLLASARLDGDASLPLGTVDPDEVAARSAELQLVIDRLGEPVTLPPAGVMDDQIARAIASLDIADAPEGDPLGTTPPGDNVVSLTERPKGRNASRRWVALAAAAAVVVAIAGAVALGNQPHTSSFDTVAAPVAGSDAPSSSTPPEINQLDSSGGPSSSTTAGASTAPKASEVPDLGAVASAEALSAEVKQESPTLAAATESSTTTQAVAATTSTAVNLPVAPLLAPVAVPSCDASVRASVPSLGELVFSATAVYQGVPVEVLVYRGSQPSSYRLIAAQADTCAVLVDRLL